MGDMSESQLQTLCAALGWQGGAYWQVVDEIRRLKTASPTPAEWKPIETAPKDGRTLLLGRFNSHGKWRTLRGQWFSADAIAESWEEPDGCDEGWYETSVECEDVPNCWWTEPTHWQPLPPAPGVMEVTRG